MSKQILGREDGMLVARGYEGTLFYATECCQADGTGSVGSPTGVACRACYATVDIGYGGIPTGKLDPSTWRVTTPGPCFDRATRDEALAVAHSGLDSIAAKRGYSMTEDTSVPGRTYLRVFNSKGRQVTGACIYPVGA